MSLLRRCVLAVVSSRAPLQARPSLSRFYFASHPVFAAKSPRSSAAAATFAPRARLVAVNARQFSAAPGPTGSSSSSTQGDEGNEANDDAGVKQVSSGRWKWVGLLTLGVGATLALAYEDLSKSDWNAGV